MLHPDAFKKCLIRSLKTDKYADYYILLEKCIKCYNEYQLWNMQYKMNNICVDRTIELKDNSKDESFVIPLNNIHRNHPYTVIRGQKNNLCKTMKQLKLKSEDIICNIPCCYANNLYNKIKEVMKGYIIFQKKYLYINDDGNVEEWSYIPEIMTNEYNHVSITRNIGLEDITLDEFLDKINSVDIMRYSY